MTRSRILAPLGAVALILALAAPALATDRRINRTKGEGLKAATAAKKRLGSGTVTRVTKDSDDSSRERYEVHIRRNGVSYELDVSSRYKVTDISREHSSGNDDTGADDHGGRRGGGSTDD